MCKSIHSCNPDWPRLAPAPSVTFEQPQMGTLSRFKRPHVWFTSKKPAWVRIKMGRPPMNEFQSVLPFTRGGTPTFGCVLHLLPYPAIGQAEPRARRHQVLAALILLPPSCHTSHRNCPDLCNDKLGIKENHVETSDCNVSHAFHPRSSNNSLQLQYVFLASSPRKSEDTRQVVQRDKTEKTRCKAPGLWCLGRGTENRRKLVRNLLGMTGRRDPEFHQHGTMKRCTDVLPHQKNPGPKACNSGTSCRTGSSSHTNV